VAERDSAFEGRNEEIVRVLMERPEATTVELIQRFHTSGQHIARLRAVARKRAVDGVPVLPPPPSGKRQVAA
jgi:DeoR/GlpR family transcriptional regulator of sugar metabolism